MFTNRHRSRLCYAAFLCQTFETHTDAQTTKSIQVRARAATNSREYAVPFRKWPRSQWGIWSPWFGWLAMARWRRGAGRGTYAVFSTGQYSHMLPSVRYSNSPVLRCGEDSVASAAELPQLGSRWLLSFGRVAIETVAQSPILRRGSAR